MSIAALIDAALNDRVLVYGSLPPAGRDLDLLLREPQRAQAEAQLTQAGCARRGATFARFANCTAEIVELCNAAQWDLCDPELEALFEQAQPLAELRWLVRPSPHHSLLILARRLVGEQGVLSDKLRARAAQAVEEDPAAWSMARSHAERWRAHVALEALEHVYLSRAPLPRALLDAARQEQRAAGRRPRVLRQVARSPRKLRRAARKRVGVVVSFSGLDGSGKSFQAAALCEVLQRLGHEAVVVRTRISWEEWLWEMVPRVKRLIEPVARLLLATQTLLAHGKLGTGPDPDSTVAPARPSASRADDPVGRLRERSPLLTDIWILVITLANAWSQWRLMGKHLLRGSIVICDRYTLDSLVELRYRYGTSRPLRPLRATLARIYRDPRRAYFLDVSPQTAFQRKGEWGIAWLSAHRALYLEECSQMGVKPLDGERPPDQICAEVAEQVWLSAIPR